MMTPSVGGWVDDPVGFEEAGNNQLIKITKVRADYAVPGGNRVVRLRSAGFEGFISPSSLRENSFF
jgi:hypothetical protein